MLCSRLHFPPNNIGRYNLKHRIDEFDLSAKDDRTDP